MKRHLEGAVLFTAVIARSAPGESIAHGQYSHCVVGDCVGQAALQQVEGVDNIGGQSGIASIHHKHNGMQLGQALNIVQDLGHVFTI